MPLLVVLIHAMYKKNRHICTFIIFVTHLFNIYMCNTVTHIYIYIVTVSRLEDRDPDQF